MVFDLIIIGAGPAGLAAAIYAHLAGLSTVVIERRLLPIDKACGEGILPPGVAALSEMGVWPAPAAQMPLEGVRFVDGDLIAQGDFPAGMGKGIRRTALNVAMAERARALGADLRLGCNMRGWQRGPKRGVEVLTDVGVLHGHLLVAADGLHSPIRHELDLDRPDFRPKRFGTRRHYARSPWSRYVEVYWAQGIEAYVTPVGQAEVSVALLWHGEKASFEALLAGFAPLRDKLLGAEATSSPRGAGPLRQGVRRRYADRVALVGDAAGYIDPLTGEGVSLALRAARALVQVIRRGESLAAYEAAYRRLSRAYTLSTELMLFFADRPRLRRRVLRGLADNPEVFSRLLGVATGEMELASFGLRRALRLARGVLA
jgi:menaquinone-9 beta-reductase